jgi:hypothetical protein
LLIIRQQFFFLDEAQNYRIWSSENPHAFVETRLHPIKVGIWIATSRRRLIVFIVKIKEPVINEVTSPFFFYLIPQYVTKRQKSNIFEFHRTLDICSFIDTLYNKHSTPYFQHNNSDSSYLTNKKWHHFEISKEYNRLFFGRLNNKEAIIQYNDSEQDYDVNHIMIVSDVIGFWKILDSK